MNKEFYKMQKTAGLITESEYKEKVKNLNEVVGTALALGALVAGAVAGGKKVIKWAKNQDLKKNLKPTGEVKTGENGVTLTKYKNEKDGEEYWGVTIGDRTKDQGYQSQNVLLFNANDPARIDKILNTDLKFDTSDETQMSDDYEKMFGQFKADKVMTGKYDTQQVNENTEDLSNKLEKALEDFSGNDVALETDVNGINVSIFNFKKEILSIIKTVLENSSYMIDKNSIEKYPELLSFKIIKK
jgi:hypothetical protein